MDDYTLDIVCEQACPIFPNTAFFTGIQAPGYLAANPTIQSCARSVIGFGPYVVKEWKAGVSITALRWRTTPQARDSRSVATSSTALSAL